MTKKQKADFALLTPVPIDHLISGIETCKAFKQVTYGSNSVSVISKIHEAISRYLYIDVLFYASCAGGSSEPTITYTARFEYYELSDEVGKAQTSCSNFRPLSTINDDPWHCFYIVSGLKKLHKPIEIRGLKSRRTLTNYSSKFYPRGPMRIESVC